MKNKFLLGSLFLALTASCATAQKSGNYSLTVNLSPDEVGMFVCLTDYDSGNKIDSALVADGVAKFNGNVDAPYYARLIIDGNRIGDLIIEPPQERGSAPRQNAGNERKARRPHQAVPLAPRRLHLGSHSQSNH